jgi:hypothetical protein
MLFCIADFSGGGLTAKGDGDLKYFAIAGAEGGNRSLSCNVPPFMVSCNLCCMTAFEYNHAFGAESRGFDFKSRFGDRV